MQVTMQVTPKITVTGDGATHAEVFEQLAGLQEVFVATMTCGKCGSEDQGRKHAIRLVMRTNNDDEKFYEAHCQNPECRARLSFGQNKKPEGQLYPRIRENNKCTVMKGVPNPRNEGKPYVTGDWLPNNGWLKWNKEKGQQY